MSNVAYTEVKVALDNLLPQQRKKIPDDIIKYIESKSNKAYEERVQDIRNYIFSEKANKMLAVIYKKYIATDEEKQIIRAKEASMNNN